MEGWRVRRWSNPNEPINRLFASTMAGGKIGEAARSGEEGCANIVSSFLHYVDWIWTGYRRGFSTRALLSFQAAPEFSTRHNSLSVSPSLLCVYARAQSTPASILLVHRPRARLRIHSFWSVYTYIHIHAHLYARRVHDRASQVHLDASTGWAFTGEGEGGRGVSAVRCICTGHVNVRVHCSPV